MILTARILDTQGAVMTADLMDLVGRTQDAAPSRIMRVMPGYRGDVTVTDNARIPWLSPAFHNDTGPSTIIHKAPMSHRR